jgi:hypothetical protein
MRQAVRAGVLAAAGFALADQTAKAQVGSDPEPKTPYTIGYGAVSVRTLASGTSITHKTRQIVAQDSEGRTYFSITEKEGQDLVTRVNIQDPVAGTRTNWTYPGNTATVTRLVPVSQGGGSGCMMMLTTPGSVDPVRPEDEDQGPKVGRLVGGAMRAGGPLPLPQVSDEVEDLGVQEILGVEARGIRITQTTPKGAAGNNEPLVTVEETWRATDPGLEHLLLRTERNDPQFGKSKQDAITLSLSEPDITSFQPPANYRLETVDLHQVPCPVPQPLEAPKR